MVTSYSSFLFLLFLLISIIENANCTSFYESFTNTINPLKWVENMQYSLAQQVTRYDSISAHKKHKYKEINTNLTYHQTLAGLFSKAEASSLFLEQPFKFNMKCDSTQSQCELVKKSLENVGRRIGKLIKITTPILVDAKFHSLCKGYQEKFEACPYEKVLGYANPASWFVAREKGVKVWSFYPQSLVKQRASPDKLKLIYGSHDISIDLNSDFKFWFPENYLDGNNSIKSDEIDFEFLVSHEITHGLGLASNWVRWSDVIPDVIDGHSFFLTPVFRMDKNNNPVAWHPLTIFDRQIYEMKSKRPFGDRENSLKSFKFRSVSPERVYSDFITSKYFKHAQDAYKLVTSGKNALFINGNKTTTFLFTTNGYKLGSTIAHFDHSYDTTQEFLMVPVLPDGRTLEDSIKSTSMNRTVGYGDIYGTQTVHLFTQMGYQTVHGNAAPELEIELNSSVWQRQTFIYTFLVIFGTLIL